jgi:hypothetical protein
VNHSDKQGSRAEPESMVGIRLQLGFSVMDVGMYMPSSAMLVHMQMDVSAACEFAQGVDTQNYQHDANTKLKRLRHSFADLKVKENDSDSRNHQRNRVTHSPEGSNQ